MTADPPPTASSDLTPSALPPPHQTWAHSICSVESLEDALDDGFITAIETDIVMGYAVGIVGGEGGEVAKMEGKMPIMAHPPDTESDLSASDFLRRVVYGKGSEVSDPSDRAALRKHVKLDFKELCVVKPTLEAISASGLRANGKAIFLNADVLEGPGLRGRGARVDGDAFLRTCVDAAAPSGGGDFAYSLGWSVDPRAMRGYTEKDVASMKDLISRHNLMGRSAGIVLAVNARVLAKDCAPLDDFLEDIPGTQLLVWTGSGEPPISRAQIDGIKGHFEGRGMSHRIGFDCRIAPSYLSGLWHDALVRIASLYWNAANLLLR